MGRAPLIARSLTVPLMASLPMSPPGKKIGSTTYESVVKAILARAWPLPLFPAIWSARRPISNTAWSSSFSRSGLRRYSRNKPSTQLMHGATATAMSERDLSVPEFVFSSPRPFHSFEKWRWAEYF